MRNRAGFSAQEWKVAYNQVKALSDRQQLDERALIRFARFGYGHHTAAALTVMLKVSPEVFVKWLAIQDYVAITVALRALGIQPDLFEAMVSTMPWRICRPTPTRPISAAAMKRSPGRKLRAFSNSGAPTRSASAPPRNASPDNCSLQTRGGSQGPPFLFVGAGPTSCAAVSNEI